MSAADMLIDTYASESVLLRAEAALAAQSRDAGVHDAAARTFISDAAGRVELAARSSLAAMVEGDTLRTLLAALRRIMKVTPVNTVALRRTVADAIAGRKGYPFA
jgi:hypothetical protein